MYPVTIERENKDCVCKKRTTKTSKKSTLPFLFSLVIAFLPKCPFCIFGYSSVLTMCSGATFHTYNPTFWSGLPLILTALVLISFIFNFKGTKTYVAAGLVFLGALLLYGATFIYGSLMLYFLAVVLIFLGVFVNGSFQYFYKRFLKS
jgi:hypothetical protein